ncbi:MAG: DUF1460 domain-containing protein [Bacteroides sp.]|nr:DUF1460 domain-containing protein [Bacteroides sp.]
MKSLHNISRLISHLAVLTVLSLGVPDISAGVRVHCSSDTVKAREILDKLQGIENKLGERCVAAAIELTGTPWAPAADNDSIGTLMVNLHGFDRMGFVNNVLALAKSSLHHMPVERQYEISLEDYSRRKGEDEGFVSQYFYGADWIVDNIYRGNLKEMTEYIGGGSFKPKTLDYVTRHADDYPAMKNPDVKDKIRMIEMGFRSHRIPHLKKQSVGNKEVKDLMEDGDIVIMLSNEPDNDIYDIGFVKMVNGEPHLIHISHENGLVVEDPYPLSRLFKLENQHFYGYRWLRPTE